MMTSDGAVTDFVVMVKVALVAPPGTTISNGTSATLKSFVPSLTVTPPGRAALVSVAVPIAGVPLGVVSRSTLSDASGIADADADGLIVSVPVADALPNVAVTFTFAAVDRFAVLKVNIEVVSPANSVTPDDIDTAPGELVDSGTNTVAVAGALRLTRPTPPSPPFTAAGWNVTELSAGVGAACTFNGALTTTSSSAAKNVTVRVVGSPRVKAVNVPDVAPPAIAPNCEPVSAANGSLLHTLTSSSGPAGHFDEIIGALTVNVPVTFWPPGTVDGEKLNDSSLGNGGRTRRLVAHVARFDTTAKLASTATVTGEVVTGNVAVVAPAGTVRLVTLARAVSGCWLAIVTS